MPLFQRLYWVLIASFPSFTSSLWFFERVRNSPTSAKSIKIASRPYWFLLHSFYVVQVRTASNRFYIDVVGTWSRVTGVEETLSNIGPRCRPGNPNPQDNRQCRTFGNLVSGTDNAGNSASLVPGIIRLHSGWGFSVCIGDRWKWYQHWTSVRGNLPVTIQWARCTMSRNGCQVPIICVTIMQGLAHKLVLICCKFHQNIWWSI